MEKIEAFVILGRIESKCENDKNILKALSDLQVALEKDDRASAAKIIGKLQVSAEKKMIEEEIKVLLTYVRSGDLLNLKVGKLNLSSRAYNALNRANINTVRDLLEAYNSDRKHRGLSNIRRLGEKSYEEIEKKLEELGLIP